MKKNEVLGFWRNIADNKVERMKLTGVWIKNPNAQEYFITWLSVKDKWTRFRF